jgi:hypothetical protein
VHKFFCGRHTGTYLSHLARSDKYTSTSQNNFEEYLTLMSQISPGPFLKCVVKEGKFDPFMGLWAA